MKKIVSMQLVLCITIMGFSQQWEKGLSPEQVMAIVKQFRPLAKQADIFIEKAKADVTQLKSCFYQLRPFFVYSHSIS